MAPVRGFRTQAFSLLLAAVSLLGAVAPAHALRLVDWNVLNYPGSSGPVRDPFYRTVLAPLNVDVLVTEEQLSQAGVTEYLNSLNTMEPGQWSAASFVAGGDTQGAAFYKASRVAFLGQRAFWPNAASHLRQINVYRFKPVGYSSNAAEFDVYAAHLKASMGFESQRLAEATGVRDSLNALPAGTHALVVGDMNFYTGTEPGMLKYVENQVDNDGRLYDPLALDGVNPWQDNTSMQYAWTQSTCKTGDTGCASGAATGGLDDRFDLILATYAFKDGAGLELVPGTYVSVGNDGLHHNNSIQDPPTIPEGSSYASALHSVSDHLPVRVDIQVPARVSASTSPIAFGTVIVGATASQNLSVSNSAVSPAEQLHYSYGAPAGFTAPAGTINLLSGASSLDAIAMSTATPGAKSGNLALNSNDLDTPALSIGLGGTVLDHASPSLDSLIAVASDTLDFGTHAIGDFSDQLARLHNRGYDALHARLAVSAAAITGPDAARFSLVGGFTPLLVAGTAASWNVHFDDTGAATATAYEATLTFTDADEALPGATALPSVQIVLRADVAGPATGVTDAGLPAVTRLYPPAPNPLTGSSLLRFDLARPASMKLEAFDLSGRRVADLADGDLPAGTHSLHWDGRAADGRALGAGLYFVRMSGRGIPTATVRLAIVR